MGAHTHENQAPATWAAAPASGELARDGGSPTRERAADVTIVCPSSAGGSPNGGTPATRVVTSVRPPARQLLLGTWNRLTI
jgi:hypothetical protein